MDDKLITALKTLQDAGIAIPPDILLALARKQADADILQAAKAMSDASASAPVEASRIVGQLQPSTLPIYSDRQPGAVPAAPSPDKILTGGGWQDAPRPVNRTSIWKGATWDQVTGKPDFDGTYLRLDAANSPVSGPLRIGTGANYVEIAADGSITLHGTATSYDDLRFPATAINPAGAPSAMTFDTVNIGFSAANGQTQVIAIIAQMPHEWKAGSTIEPHVHWQPTSTNTGSVLWRMEYKWTNIEDTEPGAYTVLNALDPADGITFKHQYASFGGISGAGKTASSILTILISRIGGDATDTYTGAALLKEFDIHYEIDKLGELETP